MFRSLVCISSSLKANLKISNHGEFQQSIFSSGVDDCDDDHQFADFDFVP